MPSLTPNPLPVNPLVSPYIFTRAMWASAVWMTAATSTEANNIRLALLMLSDEVDEMSKSLRGLERLTPMMSRNK